MQYAYRLTGVSVLSAYELSRTSDCAIALDRMHNQTAPRVLQALRKVKVTDVKIQGDHATAVLTTPSRSTFTDLQKEQGHWRIAAAPGAQ